MNTIFGGGTLRPLPPGMVGEIGNFGATLLEDLDLRKYRRSKFEVKSMWSQIY